MVVTLLKPENRKSYFQGLSDKFAAIEPPLYMAMRAEALRTKGFTVQIIDEEICNAEILGKLAEVFPNGTHPSAFIPKLDKLKERVFEISKDMPIRIWDKCPTFDIDCSPKWEGFELKKYKAHNWHCYGGLNRSPYGVIFSSYGCPYKCTFCCIKEYYRGKYQQRDPKAVLKDIKTLREDHQVKNIKILDELFMLKGDKAKALLEGIVGLGYNDLNMWCYTRLDTIDTELLPLVKKAGINWLGIGIESGNYDIRIKNNKGDFSNDYIREQFKIIRDHNIYICPNYIIGFPEDTQSTIAETTDFAIELNTECANIYSMMAYPNTSLYHLAKELGWDLPRSYSGYSQFSYDCHPIRTHALTSAEVLKARDNAWYDYHTNTRYLDMMLGKFGEETVKEIKEMTSIKLERELYGS